jgi:hypothetical protein
MDERIRRRWEELCRQAAAETDPEKLALLKREMERLLQDKEERLRGVVKEKS